MRSLIVKNKAIIGAAPVIILFILYIYIVNGYVIPNLETSLTKWFGEIIRPATIVSIMAVTIFQIIILHLILSVKTSELFYLNRLKPTLAFLIIIISLVILFESFEDSKYESVIPTSSNGIGLIIELILGAYVEEFFFRGFIFMVLYKKIIEKFQIKNKRLIAFLVMIFSSLLFGLSHVFYYSINQNSINWLSLIPPTFFGMIFCVIYLNTKNILIPITFHFLINYRFYTFPMTNSSQSLALGLITFAIIILMVIGHVIYKKGEVRYIDEL